MKQSSTPRASLPFLTLLLTWWIPPCVHGAPPRSLCDPNIFGKPQSRECHTLLDRIIPPLGTSSSRAFVEQQYNVEDDGTWPEIAQTSAAGPVQLPKIFTMKTCSIGLMKWRNPTTGAGFGMDISSWRSVQASAQTLMGTCLDGPARSGGELYIQSPLSTSPVLVVWVWASGADQWEKRLNAYMNDVNNNPMMPASAYGGRGNGVVNGTARVAEVGNGTLSLGGQGLGRPEGVQTD